MVIGGTVRDNCQGEVEWISLPFEYTVFREVEWISLPFEYTVFRDGEWISLPFEYTVFRDGKFMVGKVRWFVIAAYGPHKP